MVSKDKDEYQITVRVVIDRHAELELLPLMSITYCSPIIRSQGGVIPEHMEIDIDKLIRQLEEIVSGPPFEVRTRLKVYLGKIKEYKAEKSAREAVLE